MDRHDAPTPTIPRPVLGRPVVTRPAVVFVQGRGPEQIQQEATTRSYLAGVLAGVVRNGTLSGAGSRRTHADFPNPPQIFERRGPAVEPFLLDSAVGTDTAAPHLPGRLPPISWDGEPGYQAPPMVGG